MIVYFTSLIGMCVCVRAKCVILSSSFFFLVLSLINHLFFIISANKLSSILSLIYPPSKPHNQPASTFSSIQNITDSFPRSSHSPNLILSSVCLSFSLSYEPLVSRITSMMLKTITKLSMTPVFVY